MATFTALKGDAGELRICAEPDNLPLSHRDQSGFENKIAHLLADELHATLVYSWQPQLRGFVRKSFGADLCDAWIGVPSGFERVLTTRPYYRSTYLFVFRKDKPLRSLGQHDLKSLRIGVQVIGDDVAPAGHALARSGAVDNVVGFPLFGEGPAAARIVEAIAAGRLDAGLVWGPQAGFFAAARKLEVEPIQAREVPDMPVAFSISIGVSRSAPALRDELDQALARRKADIDAILDHYAVPRL